MSRIGESHIAIFPALFADGSMGDKTKEESTSMILIRT